MDIKQVFLIVLFTAIVVFVCCVVFFRIGYYRGRGKTEKIVKERLKQSRAVLGGLVSEQMAPLLPGFPFDPGDCRFVGKPVDFIVFNGMNSKNISEVIFLEVKSGVSKALSDQEKKLRDAVIAGKVRWAEYNPPA